jgi:integrase
VSAELLGPLGADQLPDTYRPPTPPAWLVEQIRPGETPFDALARAFLIRFGSADTREAYGRDLALWRAFLAPHDPLLAERVHADAFARALEVRRDGANTQRRRLSAVSSFYDYATERGLYRGDNPLRYVTRPPVPTGRRRALTHAQAVAMLETIDASDHEHHLRDAVILRLFFYLLLRVSEVCRLDVRDPDPATRQIVVRGKGGTETRMDTPAPVWDALARYLPHRLPPASMADHLDAAAAVELAHPGGRGRQREPLFYLHRPHVRGVKPSRGPRITPDAITSRLREIAKEAGLPPALAAALTPHDLRRTGITLLSRSAPFPEVQRTARHRRGDTTLLYVVPDEEDSGTHVLARTLEPGGSGGAHADPGAG